MYDLEFHLSDAKGGLPLIGTLLKEWKNTLSLVPSFPTLRLCEISVRKSGSYKLKLILTVECEHPTTLAAQTLEDLVPLSVSLAQGLIFKISKTSSDPSSSPTPE